MKIETLYQDEIRNEVEEIGKMTLGGEEYKATVEGATKLTDRLIKLEEIKLEYEKLSVELQKVELEEQKAKDERHDRKVKNGIVIGTSLLGAGITIWANVKGYIFEEKGTITTKEGNKALDRALNFFFKK